MRPGWSSSEPSLVILILHIDQRHAEMDVKNVLWVIMVMMLWSLNSLLIFKKIPTIKDIGGLSERSLRHQDQPIREKSRGT